MEAILVVVFLALPGLLLVRMPRRAERHVWQRHEWELLLASPMLFLGLVGMVCLAWYPDGIYPIVGAAWLVTMAFCWWLPGHQRERMRQKAAARRRAARDARKTKRVASPADR